MTAEEKDRLRIMYKEYRKMLIIQAEAYEQEQEQQELDDYNQWRINGVSPWEL